MWLVVPVIAAVVMIVGLWPTEQVPADPEARAYNLAVRLKCPICAGESLAGSQTDLAKDLRLRIDEEIAAGSTDDEIIALFVANYGEQVLLDPPTTGWGIALWAVPLGLAIVGGLAVYGLKRKESDTAEVPS
jgi:cytochrome c-type biogenesis protein CcmH